MENKLELIEKFAKVNIALTFGVNEKCNQPTARGQKIETKATRNFKPEFYCRFENEQKMFEWLNGFLAQREKQAAEKLARIVANKEAKQNLINPYKVGQIIYDSWGFDQTNIDFFQIVEVGKTSVKIQAIGQIYVESAGDMCEYVAPAPDRKIGEPFTKILVVASLNNSIYIKSKFGCFSNYDGKPKYQSHYA